jgi:hypothetical protein
MGLNLKNLPEKDFFTIDEITERWGCDLETVMHYIYDRKILRFATKTDQHFTHLNGESIQDLTAAIKLIDEVLPESIVSFVDKAYAGYLYSRCIDKNSKGLGFFLGSKVSDDLEITSYTNEIDQGSPNVSKISSAQLPKFLYQDDEHVFENNRFTPAGLDARYDLYSITVRDFKNNCYLLFQPEFKVIHITHPFLFDIITKEERDRFEKEHGITTETENVQKEVGKKTENKMLEVIKALAGALLKNGLSDNPHSDAEKVMTKLAAANQTLDCTKETLAKYLKTNRF